MNKSNREVKERKIGKVFYVSEEVLKEIYDIYQSHNCDDDSACKAEDRLGEFMMRLKSKKSYTEEETQYINPSTGEAITRERAADIAELTGQVITKKNYRLEDLPIDIIQQLPQVNEIAQKAAKGGYDNGITDMKRKLKGLRAKISKLDKSFHEGIGAESMRFDVLLLVDELLSKEFNR